MGRKHVCRNGSSRLLHKGWRDYSTRQREWILNQLHEAFVSWVKETKQTKLSKKEELVLLELVEDKVRERGIELSERELYRECRVQLRCYEKKAAKLLQEI